MDNRNITDTAFSLSRVPANSRKSSSSKFAALSPAGEALSSGEGATMVAGLYITGALIITDVSCYCRTWSDALAEQNCHDG